MWADLINSIQTNIKPNGLQEISGALLQDRLIEIINTIGKFASFAGMASTDTDPSLTGPVFFLATEKGTYQNFGNYEHDGNGLAVLVWDGAWSSYVLMQEDTFINVNNLNDTHEYYTAQQAINSIPVSYRKIGLTITFRVNSQKWATLQYQVSNLTDEYFLNTENWTDRVGDLQLQVTALNTTVAANSFNDWLNVNAINNNTGYYTLATAISAVPSSRRRYGLTITFRLDAENWSSAQYKLSNLTDEYFLNTENWNVTSKQNANITENAYHVGFAGGLGYYNTDGSQNITSLYNENTGYVYIKGFSRIELYAGNPNATTMAVALFLDKNYNVLQAYDYTHAYQDLVINSADVSTDAVFVVISARTEIDSYVRIYNANEILFNAQKPDSNYFEGKNILWLGTSIPAGSSSNDNRYPSRVAEILKCNVYNEAIPASCCRTGIPANVSISDPLGLEGAAFGRVHLSLAMSAAEKQNIIDNWATWQPLMTGAPATLTADQQADMINSSYDTIFQKYWGENPTAQIDIVIIDHLRNDFVGIAAGESVDTVPIDPYDRTTGVGAANFIIKTLLQHDNKLKIAFSGHYQSLYERVVTAQQTVAKYWNIPFLRLWEKTGFSEVEIETEGYWEDTGSNHGIWHEEGNAEGSRHMKMIDIWLPDSVHPGNDDTQKANQHLAEIIASWLKSTYAA